MLAKSKDVAPAQSPAATHIRSWVPAPLLPTIFARQNTTPTPLSATPHAPASPVLAGALWTNVLTSVQVAIFGRSFSFPAAGGGTTGGVAVRRGRGHLDSAARSRY